MLIAYGWMIDVLTVTVGKGQEPNNITFYKIKWLLALSAIKNTKKNKFWPLIIQNAKGDKEGYVDRRSNLEK